MLRAAVEAIAGFDEARAGVYLQVIVDALREPVREMLEAWIMDNQTGREAAIVPIFQKLEARGEAHGKADALLRVCARRGLTLTPEQCARVAACTDLATLNEWLDRAITANGADAVFG